ncbi:CZB domain-containing protein [Phaeobacter sp. QD34_3]|uniref:CZB domain-containing protein n=1 Tax=unclassified Phaeobacter TaxID=2621772 RepID=UPI00237F656A|nr:MULTISPECIES: CZB domain-containing protein [unclassified Phaeobacter]MDE4131892.1 CZB domain-containing protein [Phaeobacter sp. QD34_3]MDE4135530.1 CZB domain-containing protein [Phaeobacter sp. QD34_24]
MSSETTRKEISEAIKAHGTWKLRLRTASAGGPLEASSRDICRDDKCKFGQWLHAPGTRSGLSGDANYERTKKLHAEFHQAAGAIAQKIERGDLDAAKRDLQPGTPFELKTKELTTHMMAWRMGL